ncbi:unnamed protein product [Pedinophyceae sp. YPF-701]|nr:unnamed protein product [Pedinophyceae sp. YPF-701]
MGSSAIDWPEVVQATITGYDAQASYQWREVERQWRKEDMRWREEERTKLQLDVAQMNRQMEWRQEDRRFRYAEVEQRAVDNARYLWLRFVEKNRREVEEKAQLLRLMSELSALIAGFAVVGILEFNVDFDDTSEPLLALFAAFTALTVGLTANSMIVCALMHAAVLRIGKSFVGEVEEAEFMRACLAYARGTAPPDDPFARNAGTTPVNKPRCPTDAAPPQPRRNFNTYWVHRCEEEWRWSFRMFSLGVACFLSSLACSFAIKFDGSDATRWLGIALIGSAFLYWAFNQRQFSDFLLRDEQLGATTWLGQAGEGKRGGDDGAANLVMQDQPWCWHNEPAAVELESRDTSPGESVLDGGFTDGSCTSGRRSAQDMASASSGQMDEGGLRSPNGVAVHVPR